MAPRATLKQEALVKLGAERLARLVLEEASRNAPFKRIATAALAAAEGPDAVAAIVDKRLAALERARGVVNYDRRKAFLADLESLVAVITEELGRGDPGASSDRLLRFLSGAGKVLERVDDPSGSMLALYEEAALKLPDLIQRMGLERRRVIGRLIPAMLDDTVGVIGPAIIDLIPSLDAAEHASIGEACRRTLSAEDAGPSRGWRQTLQQSQLRKVQQAVADAGDDVDSFIALESSKPEVQRDTVGIAERLLRAGRLAEALAEVRRPLTRTLKVASREDLADRRFDFDVFARRRVRLELEVLEAMSEGEAAQRLRLQTFRDQLDPEMLRAYVGKLPDFEDDEALDEAFAYVATHPRRHAALGFFLRWPRLDLAAKLVLDQAEDWDGHAYEVLAPAAEALGAGHAVAATILFRALIDDVLSRGRSQAYGHAARHLAQLDLMATEIAGSTLEPHDTYRATLRRAHGRKQGFWSRFGTS